MGNVNMEAYQVHFEGKTVAEKLKELNLVAQQVADLPTFTSDDRIFLEAVPAMPTEEGKTVLTATTDDHGNTDLTYETPDVEGDDIAPLFDDTAAYSEGDLVYYEGVLYKFDADHAAGAWDPTEATQTSVAAEFNQLKNTLIVLVGIHRITPIVTNLNNSQYVTLFNNNFADKSGVIMMDINDGSYSYMVTLNTHSTYQRALYKADNYVEIDRSGGTLKAKLVGNTATGTISQMYSLFEV